MYKPLTVLGMAAGLALGCADEVKQPRPLTARPGTLPGEYAALPQCPTPASDTRYTYRDWNGDGKVDSVEVSCQYRWVAPEHLVVWGGQGVQEMDTAMQRAASQDMALDLAIDEAQAKLQGK